MMAQEGTETETSVQKDPILTADTSDCSTQTFGLDGDFFSFNIPPRLRWVDVGCGTSRNDWASLVDEWREHGPSTLTNPVQGPGLVGQISSCSDVSTFYPDKTPNHPDHGCHETSHANHKSFIKQEDSDWFGNSQVINNMALIGDQTRLDVIPCQQFPQPHNTPPTTVQEMYPGLHKVFLKPVFSYACLIAMALKHSPDNRLPVNEIYNYMQWEFPYFRTAPEGWKNSVRHNLSLNKAFYKVDRTPVGPLTSSLRPLSITGKGCYWLLDPVKENAMNEEILKWKRKHPEAVRASMANPANYWNPPNTGLGSPPEHLRKVLVPSRARYKPYPRTLRSMISVEDLESCISGNVQQSPVGFRDQSTGNTQDNISGNMAEGHVDMVARQGHLTALSINQMVPHNIPLEEKWVVNDGVLFRPDFIG